METNTIHTLNKKILYIDMDGVIADFAKGINDIDPSVDMSENPVDYETRSNRVVEICNMNRAIFHKLEPMKDSIEYVKKLFDIYDVYFLSTPMWTLPESFTGKCIWIERHFGKDAIKKLILTHRKDLNVGDFLVDDRKHNGAGEFTGEHIHYGTGDFMDWKSVYEYLISKCDTMLPPYQKADLNESMKSWAESLGGIFVPDYLDNIQSKKLNEGLGHQMRRSRIIKHNEYPRIEDMLNKFEKNDTD